MSLRKKIIEDNQPEEESTLIETFLISFMIMMGLLWTFLSAIEWVRAFVLWQLPYTGISQGSMLILLRISIVIALTVSTFVTVIEKMKR